MEMKYEHVPISKYLRNNCAHSVLVMRLYLVAIGNCTTIPAHHLYNPLCCCSTMPSSPPWTCRKHPLLQICGDVAPERVWAADKPSGFLWFSGGCHASAVPFFTLFSCQCGVCVCDEQWHTNMLSLKAQTQVQAIKNSLPLINLIN